MRTSAVPKEISALKMRHNLGEILDQVANQRLRFVVKRAGTPAAIVMSVQDYEDLQDLVETVLEEADPEFQKSLVRGREAIDTGRFSTAADLWRDLKRRKAKVRRLAKARR